MPTHLTTPMLPAQFSECCEAAVAFSLAVELERWDAVDGKGIDDLLAAGKSPELLVGEAALAAIREALAAAAAGEPPAAPGGLECIVELLANGGAVVLFRNREMLTELARLKNSDLAAFAACRATLKSGFLQRSRRCPQAVPARPRPRAATSASG